MSDLESFRFLASPDPLDGQALADSALISLSLLEPFYSLDRRAEHRAVVGVADKIVYQADRYLGAISNSVLTANDGCSFAQDAIYLCDSIANGQHSATELQTFLSSMLALANRAQKVAIQTSDDFRSVRIALLEICRDLPNELAKAEAEDNASITLPTPMANSVLCEGSTEVSESEIVNQGDRPLVPIPLKDIVPQLQRAQNDLEQLVCHVGSFVDWWTTMKIGLSGLEKVIPQMKFNNSNPLRNKSVRQRWEKINGNYVFYTQRIAMIEDYFPALTRKLPQIADKHVTHLTAQDVPTKLILTASISCSSVSSSRSSSPQSNSSEPDTQEEDIIYPRNINVRKPSEGVDHRFTADMSSDGIDSAALTSRSKSSGPHTSFTQPLPHPPPISPTRTQTHIADQACRQRQQPTLEQQPSDSIPVRRHTLPVSAPESVTGKLFSESFTPTKPANAPIVSSGPTSERSLLSPLYSISELEAVAYGSSREMTASGVPPVVGDGYRDLRLPVNDMLYDEPDALPDSDTRQQDVTSYQSSGEKESETSRGPGRPVPPPLSRPVGNDSVTAPGPLITDPSSQNTHPAQPIKAVGMSSSPPSSSALYASRSQATAKDSPPPSRKSVALTASSDSAGPPTIHSIVGPASSQTPPGGPQASNATSTSQSISRSTDVSTSAPKSNESKPPDVHSAGHSAESTVSAPATLSPSNQKVAEPGPDPSGDNSSSAQTHDRHSAKSAASASTTLEMSSDLTQDRNVVPPRTDPSAAPAKGLEGLPLDISHEKKCGASIGEPPLKEAGRDVLNSDAITTNQRHDVPIATVNDDRAPRAPGNAILSNSPAPLPKVPIDQQKLNVAEKPVEDLTGLRRHESTEAASSSNSTNDNNAITLDSQATDSSVKIPPNNPPRKSDIPKDATSPPSQQQIATGDKAGDTEPQSSARKHTTPNATIYAMSHDNEQSINIPEIAPPRDGSAVETPGDRRSDPSSLTRTATPTSSRPIAPSTGKSNQCRSERGDVLPSNQSDAQVPPKPARQASESPKVDQYSSKGPAETTQARVSSPAPSSRKWSLLQSAHAKADAEQRPASTIVSAITSFLGRRKT